MQLVHHITAEIRRMGKRYAALEALLPSMTREQQHDLLMLIYEAKDSEKRRLNGQARRMGLPPGILR